MLHYETNYLKLNFYCLDIFNLQYQFVSVLTTKASLRLTYDNTLRL